MIINKNDYKRSKNEQKNKSNAMWFYQQRQMCIGEKKLTNKKNIQACLSWTKSELLLIFMCFTKNNFSSLQVPFAKRKKDDFIH